MLKYSYKFANIQKRVTIDANLGYAWTNFSEGKFGADDRIKRLGVYQFNGRVSRVNRSPDGAFALEIVTFEDEADGGLGVVLCTLSNGMMEHHSWESIAKEDTGYAKLKAYSQGTEPLQKFPN